MRTLLFAGLLALLTPTIALATPYEYRWQQKSANDMEYQTRDIAPPSANAVLRYDTSTNLAAWLNYGSSLVVTSGTLDAVTTDWAATTGPSRIIGKPTAPTLGAPISRTFSLATAYQCTDTTKPCTFVVSLQATSAVTLASPGVNNEAQVVIGTTTDVVNGTGTVMADWKNNVSAGLVVGVTVSNTQAGPITIDVPAGYYYAIRQTAGTGVTILRAREQAWSL